MHYRQLLLVLPFNGLFSGTTWVSQYQKGKTSLDLNEARDDGGFGMTVAFSWTICKQSAPHSRQITTPTPHHSIFTGRMLFLTPNQQCQSTEGTNNLGYNFCEMVKKWGLTSFRPRRKTVLVGKRRPAVSNSFCRSSPNLSMTRKRFVVLPSLC